MSEHNFSTTACETAAALTYGMSKTLRNSGILGIVGGLSQEDKVCLIRYIRQTGNQGQEAWEDIDDDLPPALLLKTLKPKIISCISLF